MSTKFIEPSAKITEALKEIEINAERMVVVASSEDNELFGTITDGDIRRILTRVQKPFAAILSDDVIAYAIKNPITVNLDTLLTDAIDIMGQRKIWDLPVLDSSGKLLGLLHLHRAIEALLSNNA